MMVTQGTKGVEEEKVVEINIFLEVNNKKLQQRSIYEQTHRDDVTACNERQYGDNGRSSTLNNQKITLAGKGLSKMHAFSSENACILC